MHKHPVQLLIFTLWLSLLSLTALAGSSSAEPEQSPPTTATGANETGTWDKTREMGSSAMDTSREIGSAVVRKSKETYQAVKEKGSAAGQMIAETSRNAWEKTKQTGSLVAEKASEFGSAIADKSRSLYRQATQPAERPAGREI